MVATALMFCLRSAYVGRRIGVAYSANCSCHRLAATYTVALIVCQIAVDEITNDVHISGSSSCSLIWWLNAALCCIAAGCSPTFMKMKQTNKQIELESILWALNLFCVFLLFFFIKKLLVISIKCWGKADPEREFSLDWIQFAWLSEVEKAKLLKVDNALFEE